MSTDSRDTSELEKQLHEIRQLEERVAALKRNLISSSESTFTGFRTSDARVPFLVVECRDRSFAFPVELVDEVFEMVAVTELPEERPGVVGLLDYHGKLMVLFDLADLAGMGKSEIDPAHAVILCAIHDVRFALMASSVSEVMLVHGDEITSGNEIMTGVLKEVGVIRTEHTTASVIDIWSAVLSTQIDWIDENHATPPAGDASLPESNR